MRKTLSLNVLVLAINPQRPRTLYAGTTDRGIFKSNDGGDTWQALNVGLSNLIVDALVVDPARPRTVYAGSFGGGVFRSISGAEGGWFPINRGLADIYVGRLALAPAADPTAPTRLYAGTRRGVFDIIVPPVRSTYISVVVQEKDG